MTTAYVDGQVLSAGTSPVLENGFVYAKIQHPTIESSKSVYGEGEGEFLLQLTQINQKPVTGNLQLYN